MTDDAPRTGTLRKHLFEWPYWCLLATRAASASDADVPPLLEELTGHAARLALPVTYEAGKGTLWATTCRLFFLFRLNGKEAGKIGYVHMIFGIGRAFASPQEDGHAKAHMAPPGCPGWNQDTPPHLARERRLRGRGCLHVPDGEPLRVLRHGDPIVEFLEVREVQSRPDSGISLESAEDRVSLSEQP